MKTDADLEALLRETFIVRTAEVTESPGVVLPVRSHQLRRWLPAIAAAVVIAVAAGVIVGSRLTHKHAPAHPTPRPTPSPANIVKSCTTTLPAAWTSALDHGASRYGATSATPIGLSADGHQLLVARDYGTARDVAIVTASGAAKRIYQVPDPNMNQVMNGSIEGNYAALDLQREPRNANGVIPTDLAVVLIDLRTGKPRNLDTVSEAELSRAGRTIDGSTMVDGQVYWDVHPTFANRTGVINDYDVATNRTRILYRGAVGPPVVTALGVTIGWGIDHLIVPNHLPPPVQGALAAGAQRASLSTDGSAYAWIVGRRIGWWAPGAPHTTEITFPSGEQPDIDAVAGDFVFYSNMNSLVVPGGRVLDVHTGATASVGNVIAYGLARNHVLVGYHFVAGFKSSPTEPVRIDTSRLPALRC